MSVKWFDTPGPTLGITMVVRRKEIPKGSGNFYDYQQETVREGGKVRTRHVRYIGRSEDMDTEADMRRLQAERETARRIEAANRDRARRRELTQEQRDAEDVRDILRSRGVPDSRITDQQILEAVRRNPGQQYGTPNAVDDPVIRGILEPV